MEDDELTYVALERDGGRGAAVDCRGVPTLLHAVDDVMDTFEDAVEDQKWFRFLKKKYDAFNHLDDDRTMGTLTICETIEEDMTLNTFTGVQLAAPNHIQEHIDQKDEDQSELPFDVVEKTETQTLETHAEDHAELFTNAVQAYQVADTEGNDDVSMVEDVKEDDAHDDEEDEIKEKDDASLDDEDEGIEIEKDQSFYFYQEEEDAPDDEVTYNEGDIEDEYDRPLTPLAEVELTEEGTVIIEQEAEVEPELDKVASRTRSQASSQSRKYDVEHRVSSTISLPAVKEVNDVDETGSVELAESPLSPTPSFFGMEMPSELATFTSFAFPTRERSSATEESQRTNNTAETTKDGHKIETSEEIHGNVEVIGVKEKKRFSFPFWKKLSKKSKRKKSSSRVKSIPHIPQNEKQPSSKPKYVPRSPNKVKKTVHSSPNKAKLTPKSPFKTKIRGSVFHREPKEKPLPKTTVIVTRTSD